MEYKFKFQAGPEQWSAFPRIFKVGEQIKKFRGHTYGLDRDDMMFMGRETIPVVNGDGFFTCPVEFLEDDNGVQPMGDYIRPSRKLAK